MRRLTSMLLFLAVSAPPALADGGGAPSPPPTPRPGATPDQTVRSEKSPRELAERYYADAYGDIEKAKKELAKGKEKNARKKFKRALKRSEKAIALDPKYFEAWNLLGYSQRKLGELEKALESYDACLEINPRYVPAREYLGEAYVELGKLDKAKEQLAWLEKLEAEHEAKELSALIAAKMEAGKGQAKKDAAEAASASSKKKDTDEE